MFVNNYIPMDGRIKSGLNLVVVITVAVWLVQTFVIIGSLKALQIR